MVVYLNKKNSVYNAFFLKLIFLESTRIPWTFSHSTHSLWYCSSLEAQIEGAGRDETNWPWLTTEIVLLIRKASNSVCSHWSFGKFSINPLWVPTTWHFCLYSSELEDEAITSNNKELEFCCFDVDSGDSLQCRRDQPECDGSPEGVSRRSIDGQLLCPPRPLMTIQWRFT